MKTKTLRLPVLFASAGALIWTVSVARAADSSLEVRQDSSTSQKEVINEPSGADRTYSTRIESGPAYDSSYRTRTYESSQGLDPDTEGDRIMHMYQRGRHAAESLDRQIKPNPIVVLPGATTFESSSTVEYPPNHLGELHQQTYSSSFNEPSAAERESSTSSSTTRRYSTSDTSADASATATLSSGTTVKASDLIGMNIKNSSGERIGEVKDVVLDLKSGRVAYAVVSAGGIAGIGDKWLAVPPTLFSRTGTDKTVTWDIDKEKLSSAPTIDKHNWNAAYQQDYIGNVYSFYGVENYEANEPAGSQKKSDTQYHHDSDQQNRQDKDQQDKQNKDQSRNDASSSGVSSQSAATQSSQQSDLQKSEPEKSASSSADVSKESAGAQPSSSAQSSSSATSSGTQSSASSSDLKSSTDVNAPAGAQSSGTSSEATKSDTEPQSGTANSQANVTTESAGATASGSLPEKAQMALKNDASLAGSAQNVQFEMKEDKLCVKGTVKSEDEKNRILEKVRATAGDTKVDDQLKVSSSSDSNDSDNDSK